MKLRTLCISMLVFSAAFWFASPVRADKRKSNDRDQRVEKSIAAAETVAISLCVTSGDITVRGWDRKEIRARARNAAQIELRRDGAELSGPASRVTVLLSGSGTAFRTGGVDCQVFGDVELDVPSRSTVRLRTGDGIVRVVGVASAFIDTQSGDIDVADVSNSVEAGSLSGIIKVTNCSGRARLHSVGGSIDATNLSSLDGDEFSASTVSGDVTLERISHRQVNAKTATGRIVLSGPLVKGARYSFGTLSGDVTLRLPADSSFQINAKVSPQGDIVTDFPLKSASEAASAAPVVSSAPVVATTKKTGVPKITKVDAGTRKVSGVHGTGDATISLASFSGTLSLRKE
jgi:putative adhesin